MRGKITKTEVKNTKVFALPGKLGAALEPRLAVLRGNGHPLPGGAGLQPAPLAPGRAPEAPEPVRVHRNVLPEHRHRSCCRPLDVQRVRSFAGRGPASFLSDVPDGLHHIDFSCPLQVRLGLRPPQHADSPGGSKEVAARKRRNAREGGGGVDPEPLTHAHAHPAGHRRASRSEFAEPCAVEPLCRVTGEAGPAMVERGIP